MYASLEEAAQDGDEEELFHSPVHGAATGAAGPAPTKPKSGYLMFCGAERPAVAAAAVGRAPAVVSELARRWSALAPAARGVSARPMCPPRACA